MKEIKIKKPNNQIRIKQKLQLDTQQHDQDRCDVIREFKRKYNVKRESEVTVGTSCMNYLLEVFSERQDNSY